ncbi:MAG: pentapeptide repeat-containing protein, partial [Candidatus Desulfacyla sp.]
MTLYKKWRYLAVTLPLTSGLFALLLSCGNDSTTPSSQPRAWYYEHEFTDNPGLAARPEQVVILDILPGEGLSEHPIPYLYEEGGGCLFAIPSDDPFITRTEIFDRSGVLVAATERGDGGAYLEMSPGNYSMKVYHDGAGVPEEGSAAFIRRQDEEAGRSDAVPAAGEDQGTSPINCTYPAYVAIQFLSGDYAGQYLAVTSGWVWDDGKDVDVQFMKAVSTNTTGDAFETKRHLFSFEDAEPNCCYGQTYPPFAGAYMLHSWVAETASQFFTYYLYSCSSDWGIKCPPSQNKLMSEANVISIPLFYPTQYPPTPLVQDMGGGAFLLWALADPYPIDDFTECSPLYAAENGYIYFTEFSTTASPATLTIVDGFCFYRDGSQIDRNSLGAGEVALYEGENYTGVAVLLSASFPETTLLPLEQVGSVAFGLYTDTTIRFFSDPNYTNPVKTVGVDTPSIADLSGSDIGSIKIFDSRKMLISSKECPSCNLAGVDLSNLNLDGADLSDANLMNADLHVTSLKQGNLSGALLNGANLTSVNLSGASLLNASLNADSDMNLAAATLTGAYLQNVNCKGADLGGADFTNASFHTLALAYNP